MVTLTTRSTVGPAVRVEGLEKSYGKLEVLRGSTWLAVIPGLSATSIEVVSAFSYPLIFLPFLSSSFVPTDTMPGPVRWFAENQPVTSIVNTIRDLFAQQPAGDDIWVAPAWCVAILVVAYGLAMITYRRKVA